MKKSQFIEKYSQEYNTTKKDATEIVENMINLITDTLVSGDNIAIQDFGTLEVRTRAARTGVSPQDGSPINIPESKIVYFKTGKGLKSLINK